MEVQALSPEVIQDTGNSSVTAVHPDDIEATFSSKSIGISPESDSTAHR